MANLPRVFVARPLPRESLARLDGRAEVVLGPDAPSLDRARLLDEASNADAMVSVLTDRIDAELLERCERLLVVSNYAVGFNNIDLSAAERLGIWVTNTPDVVTDSTADLAIGLLIAAARRTTEAEKLLRAGGFSGWSPTHWFGAHVTGATLGIVGMGRIGKATARRARAFDMRIVYTGRRRLPEDEERSLGASWRSLDGLLAESDFVSLHCPLNAQTRHLIDARALALMKQGAVLINTSRGPLVDEEALARALHEGRLGGAGLDVFEEEPAVHPLLLAAPNAVLVPHIGTSTIHTRIAMADRAIGDVLRVLDGEQPRFAVNRPESPRASGRVLR